MSLYIYNLKILNSFVDFSLFKGNIVLLSILSFMSLHGLADEQHLYYVEMSASKLLIVE